jgi:hypothetical protein
VTVEEIISSGETKMVTTLSQLVEMIERGTVPTWLRDEITAKRKEISNVVRDGGEVVLSGPKGERVNIRADKQAVAA